MHDECCWPAALAMSRFFPGSCRPHSICLGHLLTICFHSRVARRSSMRLSPAYACLAASVLLLGACGNSTHPIGCAGTDASVLQNYVYATTNASQVLVFPVSQNGALQPPTSVPGPALVGGAIAISPPSRELFVGDHVLDKVSAFVLNGNQYLGAPGSPYPGGAGPSLLEAVASTPDGKFVYVLGLNGTISGFSVAANGSLSVISGSPFSVAANSVDAVIDAS